MRHPQVKNYVPWNRNWVTVRRHLPLVAKAVAIGAGAALFWTLARSAGLHFPHEDQEPLLLGAVPFVGLIYVLFATVAISSVFNRYTRLSAAVVKKDLDTFLVYRDEQLPILMHLLVGLPSIALAVLIGLVDYGSATVGIAAVFSTTFVLALGWIIAVELDDFNNSIWFQVAVPQQWWEIDIEAHFTERIEVGG